MLNRCLITSLLCVACVHVFANNYEDAWKALNRNDRKAALQYYPAMKNFLNNIVKAESKYIDFKEE
jgi:transposase